MTSLLNWGAGDAGGQRITDVYLDREPRLVILFTAAMEEASLHFIADPSVRRSALCPGSGCPLCGLGGAPQLTALLPLYDVESAQVKVLKISSARGPASLRSVLVRHLANPNIANLAVLLRKESNYSYVAEARPLAATAGRGEEAIRAFMLERQEGLELCEALWRPSASELCELPTIRAKLDAIGGLPSSTSDAVPF
ncbi:MAG: hypothetical protein IPN34_17405 [Planctomycetes bacterium]|nr:hypothetical protein [Planctomycetota bacterium]